MKFPFGRIRPLSGALLFLILVACAPQPRLNEASNSAAADPAAALGIEIVGLHLSSGGYMLDFRYKVLDAARAAPMIDHALIPYLVHEESGAKFAVPAPAKVGPMRQMPRQLEAGRQYFIFFANPGRFVKAGDFVTIVHGSYRFEHLRVE